MGQLPTWPICSGDGVREAPVPVGATVPQRADRSSPLSWRMTKAGIVFHHRVVVLGRGLAHRAQGDARADARLLHALGRGGVWPCLRRQPIGGERQGSGLFGMTRDSDDDDDRMSFLMRSLDWNTLVGLSPDHSPVSPTRQMNLTRSYSGLEGKEETTASCNCNKEGTG